MTEYFLEFETKTYPGHLRLDMNWNESMKVKTNTNANIIGLQRIAGNSFIYGCYFKSIYIFLFLNRTNLTYMCRIRHVFFLFYREGNFFTSRKKQFTSVHIPNQCVYTWYLKTSIISAILLISTISVNRTLKKGSLEIQISIS